MYTLADMVRRKAKHRINTIILKRNIPKLPDIEAAIEEGILKQGGTIDVKRTGEEFS